MLFPFGRGGGMWVSSRLAADGLFDDTFIVLLVFVLLRLSGTITSCLAHPAIFNIIIGSYRVQQAAGGYLIVAGLVKGLLGDPLCGPGTHILKTYTPPFRCMRMTLPVAALVILPPSLSNVTSFPAADR